MNYERFKFDLHGSRPLNYSNFQIYKAMRQIYGGKDTKKKLRVGKWVKAPCWPPFKHQWSNS
jgi:hypothetical protein